MDIITIIMARDAATINITGMERTIVMSMGANREKE